MKKQYFLPLTTIVIISCMVFVSCNKPEENKVVEKSANSKIALSVINSVIDELSNKYGKSQKSRIEKGVKQVANLWHTDTTNGQPIDGSVNDFRKFCIDNFIGEPDKLAKMFHSVQTHFEVIMGHFNKISLDLKRPIHLDGVNVTPIDEIFGGYEPNSNFINDMYANKIAFMIGLNFPYWTLAEKEEFGEKWSREEWAYVRLGDIFTSRVPSNLLQKYSESLAKADFYISNYNIYMGSLQDNSGNRLFPADMKLITHWNLRDEIKAEYGDSNSLLIQQMIFEVMKHIIRQDIPKDVINSDKYTWNPLNNKVFSSGKEIKLENEPNTRYQYLLNSFKWNKEIDKYRPNIGNAINQTFDVEYEMPQLYVEKMYIDFISSPQVKQVAELITKRMGRKLLPFDIWYDGFKSRSSINQDMLTNKTSKLYPNTSAVEKDIPNILTKLGFDKSKANEIAARISVDAAKGAGHAWGAEMKGEKAHLRTRIVKGGMDYKGYNIAVHELGHNVEQTLSLYDIDNWFIKGVPNTAFTEAWAFVFQNKDLDLLGIKDNSNDKEALDVLDKFWSCYEIMGVSLVDQRTWKWMYDNPNCNAEELKNAVIKIAGEIWNQYYEPILGEKDCPILAIYSHMIDYPLYLSAYPIGHLIEFQMSEYMKGKNIGKEMQRIVTQGRLLPDIWMKQAVGDKVSTKPLLDATSKAVKEIM
jgi:hypothetical protein